MIYGPSVLLYIGFDNKNKYINDNRFNFFLIYMIFLISWSGTLSVSWNKLISLANRTITNLQSVGNNKKQEVGSELLNYFFPQIDHEQ